MSNPNPLSLFSTIDNLKTLLLLNFLLPKYAVCDKCGINTKLQIFERNKISSIVYKY